MIGEKTEVKTVSVNHKNQLGHKSEHGYKEGYSYDNRDEDLPDERSTCDDKDGEPPGKTAVIRHKFFFAGQQKAVRDVIISGGDHFILCSITLSRYGPIWPNTHFNHVLETISETAEACDCLLKSGVPVNNQSVLLRGINDSVEGMQGQKSGSDELALRNYERRIFHYRKPAKLLCMSSPPRFCVQPLERLRAYLNNRVPFRVRRSSKCG